MCVWLKCVLHITNLPNIPLENVGSLRPLLGARCSSVVRAFAHGAMGRRVDPS